MVAAGFPSVLVQVAFTSQATSTTPTWVDLSSRCSGFRTKRGRDSDLSVCNPGDMQVRLDNTDDALNADNPSGPYYGYLRPNRQCRIVATVGGTLYYLSTGFADSWVRTWPGGAGASETSLSATDRFKILSRRATGSLTRSAEDASTRLTALLVDGGVALSGRTVLSSYASRNLVAYNYTGGDVLTNCQDIVRSDGGQLFVDGVGVVTYQPVTYRQIGGATRARTSQARFGNDATSIPVEDDLDPTVDDTLMANRVLVTDGTGAGTVHTAQDTTAQAEDGLLELDLGATLLASTDAADRAADVLSLRKNPTPRYDSLTVNLLTLTTAEQQTVLGLEISDRVTVAVIPPGRSSGTARDQWVESIEHTMAAGQSWTVTFGLSSAGDAAVVIP